LSIPTTRREVRAKRSETGGVPYHVERSTAIHIPRRGGGVEPEALATDHYAEEEAETAKE
jgi:hypothetical protein